MAQASVLNETEIRRVFRIVEATRHAERDRRCFVLSIYSGLRVGVIAALTVAPLLQHRTAMSDAKSNLGRIRPRDRKVVR
jgi:integrase